MGTDEARFKFSGRFSLFFTSAFSLPAFMETRGSIKSAMSAKNECFFLSFSDMTDDVCPYLDLEATNWSDARIN